MMTLDAKIGMIVVCFGYLICKIDSMALDDFECKILYLSLDNQLLA
jgi:hypothetical protein